MSSFICSNEIFQTIADGLDRVFDPFNRVCDEFHGIAANTGLQEKVLRPSPSLEVSESIRLNIAAVMRELYAMNVDAVNYRYPQHSKASTVPVWSIRVTGKTPTAIVLLKSMDCLLYQCSEGDIDECDLYKDLEKIIDSLAGNIVRGSKEYDDCKAWG